MLRKCPGGPVIQAITQVGEPIGQLVQPGARRAQALAESVELQAGSFELMALVAQQAGAQGFGVLAALTQALGRMDQARRQPVQALLTVGQSAFEAALQLLMQGFAAGGVGARRSAAKSAMVKSVSWPTPEMIGMVEAAMARATASSLKAQRSSMLPPPRHRMIASQSVAAAWPSASAILAAAPSPWTRVGQMVMRRCGARRCRVVSTSRRAAACRLVTMAMWRGKAGRGFLRSAANRPSFSSCAFRRRKRSNRSPWPARRMASILSWNSPRDW